MAEPNTTSAAASATVIGLAGTIPGVDGDALIGAFAGATLVVVTAKDLSIPTRVAYMAVSLVMGYLAAPEITYIVPIRSTGVAAFFAAALVIAVTLTLTERVKRADLLSSFRRDD
jgi:cell division protein FtsW (lipid II flippase)